tara:strand:+ start:500 stop:853 length:354 start_codon:yes stop_codon:yes gene_type:complete
MNIEDLRDYCLSFKGTSEAIKWDTALTFMVSTKIFVLSSVDAFPTRCSIKVEREVFEELIEDDNFIQAPYLAKNQWIQIQDIEQVKDNQLKALVSNSYSRIKSKLTKKLQKEIDLLD